MPAEYAPPNLSVVVCEDKVIVESYGNTLVIRVDKIIDIKTRGKWRRREVTKEQLKEYNI